MRSISQKSWRTSCTRTATQLVAAGHEVASEQFKYAGDYSAPLTVSNNNLEITRTEKRLTFTAGKIKGEFDIQRAQFISYTSGGKKIIESFPEPYFWRAPTDNDFGNRMQFKLGVWRSAHFSRTVKSVSVNDSAKDQVDILVDYTLNDVDVPYQVNYSIQNDGSIKVSASIDMTARNLPELPRFGMRMNVAEQYNKVTYYGRGPWENYSDRNFSSFVGAYTTSADSMFQWNYLRPQESGYRTDVRWFELTNQQGEGLHIEGIQPVCFSALKMTDEDLDPGLTKKQQHPTDIKLRGNITLHIDHKQRGVGGDDSWGALPHNEYRLLDKQYAYSYTISLIDKK
ncbi:MAG: hypothetical protein EOO04_34050 [Chitinophagaceae bacterium]|nr:MAG: hypothetical protein EOO04_34050 [Chitinophagaceae bacterium]